MNRLEEYEAMLQELEQIPASDPVGKAKKRRSRQKILARTFGTLAAVLCLFVGTINVSPTVSAACREIPFLAELTKLLTFNPSLQLAVDNDYVQLIGQEQSKNDITARIEYLIVDQKQLNVYYRLDSDVYEALDASPEVQNIDGSPTHFCISYGGIYEENDELRDLTIDSADQDLPPALQLTLRVHDNGSFTEVAPATPLEEPAEDEEPLALAEFTFLLEFDPQFTEQGRTVAVNRELDLNGQHVTVTNMEIYPTHIRINIDEAADNTAWLQDLHFHLETQDGRRVETISNGISASGNEQTPSMTTYRAESTFFYDADAIRLVIEGADFREKEKEQVYVNLKTLEHDPLPDGIAIESAERIAGGWELNMRMKTDDFRHVQIFQHLYYDEAGNEYEINRYATFVDDYDQEESWIGWTKETYYLDSFPADEVWLKLYYTKFWTPDAPLVVELQ